MRVIVYMQFTHMTPTRADMHAWECVQTCRLLLIGQRLVVVKTGRPHTGDAHASRPRTPQGQVNDFGHITPLHLEDGTTKG